MRLAQSNVDRRLGTRIDKTFIQDAKAKLSAGRLTLACEHGSSRERWMNLFVEQGGKVNEVCGERVANLSADPLVAQIADGIFYAKNPRLRKRKLTLSHKDRTLRSKWMDLYVLYGGPVTVICEPDREKCMGIR